MSRPDPNSNQRNIDLLLSARDKIAAGNIDGLTNEETGVLINQDVMGLGVFDINQQNNDLCARAAGGAYNFFTSELVSRDIDVGRRLYPVVDGVFDAGTLVVNSTNTAVISATEGIEADELPAQLRRPRIQNLNLLLDQNSAGNRVKTAVLANGHHYLTVVRIGNRTKIFDSRYPNAAANGQYNDSSDFPSLFPDEETDYLGTQNNTNCGDCVLRVRQTLLDIGDINALTNDQLMQCVTDELRADAVRLQGNQVNHLGDHLTTFNEVNQGLRQTRQQIAALQIDEVIARLELERDRQELDRKQEEERKREDEERRRKQEEWEKGPEAEIHRRIDRLHSSPQKAQEVKKRFDERLASNPGAREEYLRRFERILNGLEQAQRHHENILRQKLEIEKSELAPGKLSPQDMQRLAVQNKLGAPWQKLLGYETNLPHPLKHRNFGAWETFGAGLKDGESRKLRSEIIERIKNHDQGIIHQMPIANYPGGDGKHYRNFVFDAEKIVESELREAEWVMDDFLNNGNLNPDTSRFQEARKKIDDRNRGRNPWELAGLQALNLGQKFTRGVIHNRRPEEHENYQRYLRRRDKMFEGMGRFLWPGSSSGYLKAWREIVQRLETEGDLSDAIVFEQMRDLIEKAIREEDEARKKEVDAFGASWQELNEKALKDAEKFTKKEDDMFKYRAMQMLLLLTPIGGLSFLGLGMDWYLGPVFDIFGDFFDGSATFGEGVQNAVNRASELLGPLGIPFREMRIGDALRLFFDETPLVSNVFEAFNTITDSEIVQNLFGATLGELGGSPLLPVLIAGAYTAYRAPGEIEHFFELRETYNKDNQLVGGKKKHKKDLEKLCDDFRQGKNPGHQKALETRIRGWVESEMKILEYGFLQERLINFISAGIYHAENGNPWILDHLGQVAVLDADGNPQSMSLASAGFLTQFQDLNLRDGMFQDHLPELQKRVFAAFEDFNPQDQKRLKDNFLLYRAVEAANPLAEGANQEEVFENRKKSFEESQKSQPEKEKLIKGQTDKFHAQFIEEEAQKRGQRSSKTGEERITELEQKVKENEFTRIHQMAVLPPSPSPYDQAAERLAQEQRIDMQRPIMA